MFNLLISKSLLALSVLILLTLNSTNANAQDTTQTTKKTPPFNTDVYLYGTITKQIPATEVKYHVGEHIYTSGKVFSGHVLENNGATLLNVGGNYPNQDFIIVIKRSNRAKFGQPEVDLVGKTITVSGEATHYKHNLAVIVNDKNLLTIK